MKISIIMAASIMAASNIGVSRRQYEWRMAAENMALCVSGSSSVAA
jgi:hypothetical protein